MNLFSLINGVKISYISERKDIEILNISYDSRRVKSGDLFVCLRGAVTDGHKFAENAIKNGASAIMADYDLKIPGVPLIIVENTREALALISRNFFRNPSGEISTIGITGTKGKTTVSCMIKSIFESYGDRTGLIGTLGVVVCDEIINMENTTPESYEVQKYLRYMVDKGCKYAVIEASSIGLKEHRLDGIKFDYGIFTNFSEDHIGPNEHSSLEEYLECKSLLFRKCNIGILNNDDPKFEHMIKTHCCGVKTFGLSKNSDIFAHNINLKSSSDYIGSEFKVDGEIVLSSKIIIPGKFNVYNALAAISVCYYEGASKNDIISGLGKAVVKGRVEPVKIPANFNLLIDYAHNALSMENLLTTLREYNPRRLITLFGAGGNRSKLRRYEMGEISGKLSDLSVITADNSRFEDVMDIIEDIKLGINKTDGEYIVIPDRKDAIRYCIENACDGDMIVLAGKGHESYQEIKGVKCPFDERVVISEILSDMKI